MTKLKSPLFSFKTSGPLGKLFSFRTKDRTPIIEKKPQPKDTKSPSQLFIRHMYSKCTTLWHTLSEAEKQEWESLARRKHMTGYAWFISQCLKPNPGIYLPLQGGTMQGDILMDTHHITLLPEPTLDHEAATKKYVDDSIPPPDGVAIPPGLIAMWHGLLAAIPQGWHLCDGTNGTPDLRTKFIKGTAPGIEPGTTGGSATHTHNDHPALTHSGTAVTDHAAQSHAGAAVQDHAAQAHSGTTVADHAAKDTNVADAGATQRGPTASTLTLKTHIHPISAYVHSLTQPSAHPILAHSVTQPAQHPILAHSVTQPYNHQAQAHSEESNEPEFYDIAFIIKI